MACNFRCRMCYFSGNEYINNNKGTKPIDIEDYKQMAKSIFHRALKLQIGCGAEPSLYNNLVDLVRIAKDKGVPYVSITSNAKLLNYDLRFRTFLSNFAMSFCCKIRYFIVLYKYI